MLRISAQEGVGQGGPGSQDGVLKADLIESEQLSFHYMATRIQGPSNSDMFGNIHTAALRQLSAHQSSARVRTGNQTCQKNESRLIETLE